MHSSIRTHIANLSKFEGPQHLGAKDKEILSDICADLFFLEGEALTDDDIHTLYRLTEPATPEYDSCTLYQLSRGAEKKTLEAQIGMWTHFLLEREFRQPNYGQRVMIDNITLYLRERNPSPLWILALNAVQLAAEPGAEAREVSAPKLRAQSLGNQNCPVASTTELVRVLMMSVDIVNRAERATLEDLTQRLPDVWAQDPDTAAHRGHIIEAYAPPDMTDAIGIARTVQLQALQLAFEQERILPAGRIAMRLLQLESANEVKAETMLGRFLAKILPLAENQAFSDHATTVLRGDPQVVGIRQLGHPFKHGLRDAIRRRVLAQLAELRAAD